MKRALQSLAVMTAGGLLASCIMFPIGGGEPHHLAKNGWPSSSPAQPRAQTCAVHSVNRTSAAGAGGGCIAVIEGGSTSYQLLVGFHADGTVWRYGVLRGDEPCDSRRGVCYQRGKVFVELDPQAPPLDDPNCGVTYRREDRELSGCIFDP